MNLLKFLIPFFISFNTYALVDYTESQDSPKSKKVISEVAPTQNRTNLNWKSEYSLSAQYEVINNANEKTDLLNLNTHVQTLFNVFLDLSYWHAQMKKESQAGNPKLILGFNWLRLGSPAEEARLDIYGGVRLGSHSLESSSRTDKIFGMETTKRFGTFGLGLGYDLTLSGTPKSIDEKSLGNIHRITASMGMMVSNDIQFELELESFRINSDSNSPRLNRLMNEVNFSVLSPKLLLTLSPFASLELGARFRASKPKNGEELSQLKLLDIHGAKSNTLFTGLSFNI